MNLSNILPFSNQSELLVCETDGFSLRAAVIKRNSDKVEIHQTANSQLSDMAEAVKEVIAQVKTDGWQGGKAILLSPAVLSTLVELPVDPKKPRPMLQMQELLRWEVEPLLMQHTTRWTVGHLLVGQGYMSAEQAQTVMDMQQGKANPTGEMQLTDKLSLRRFGELAEELGYIRRSQLTACLAGQEWLKSDDETIDCGWSEQGEVADVPGMYGWLVSCVNKDLLNRWHAAFENQNVSLQAMYPLTGCSNALSKEAHKASAVIESHSGMAFITRFANDNIQSQYQYLNPEKSPVECCLESYHALNISSASAVELASWQADSQTIVTELHELLATEVTLLSNDYDLKVVSLGMIGASYHAFNLAGARRCADVRFGGPLLPNWQRPTTRAAALMFCFFVLISGSELGLSLWKNKTLTHKQDIDERWRIIADANKRISAQIDQIDARKKLLQQQQDNQLKTQALLDFYSRDIPDRVALVQSILGILQNIVSDEVIINSLDELGKRATLTPVSPQLPSADKRIEVESFNLKAWAISESAAQSFIQQLKHGLKPWNLEIRNPQVEARVGPLNLSGFTVVLRIIKLAEAKDLTNTQVAKR